MILDTNFLIVLSGKNKNLPRARAEVFLRAHDGAPLYVSRVSVVEFAAGFDTHVLAARYLSAFTVLEVDDRIWRRTETVFRALRRGGVRIGLPDTIIAATGLDYALPVVTQNVAHFGRVPALDVLTF